MFDAQKLNGALHNVRQAMRAAEQQVQTAADRDTGAKRRTAKRRVANEEPKAATKAAPAPAGPSGSTLTRLVDHRGFGV